MMENCIGTRVLTKVEKGSAFSIFQYETYTSYNNCDDVIFEQTRDWNFSEPFFTVVIFSLCVVLIWGLIISERKKLYE